LKGIYTTCLPCSLELRRLETEQLQKQAGEITVAETAQRKALSASGVLLQDAEGKLLDVIKAGNMDQIISVAHAMIEIARKRMSEATNCQQWLLKENVVLTKRNVTLTRLCTRSHRRRKRSPVSLIGKNDDVHGCPIYGTEYNTKSFSVLCSHVNVLR